MRKLVSVSLKTFVELENVRMEVWNREKKYLKTKEDIIKYLLEAWKDGTKKQKNKGHIS